MVEQAVCGGRSRTATVVDGFVGRDAELRGLREDIERVGLGTLAGRPVPHCRVLLIAGEPGSGRSALAARLAQQVAGDYPDGMLHARLTDPGGLAVPTERVARDLLTALGAGAPVPGTGEDELTAVLRSTLAERRVVLIFDDVADAEQLEELIPGGRESLVLAVATGPMTGVSDVRPCVVGGLERDAAVEVLRRRAGTAPRLTVDPSRAERLAEACGDLPAALDLVGGWLAAHPKVSVSETITHLEQVPADDGPRATPRALYRAFRLAYESLSPSTARMLRLLAVAPAGFVDTQLASALAGSSPEVASVALTDCAGLGLLHTVTAGRCWTLPGCLVPLLRAELSGGERPREVTLARARMLERLVRQLEACSVIQEPPATRTQDVAGALPRGLRFDDAEAARDWLAQRRSTLWAAARDVVADGAGELDTLARRLLHALARTFTAHHEPARASAEVYRLHQLLLVVTQRGGMPRESAACLLNLGQLDARAGRLSDAVARYRSALDAARDARDTSATGRSLEGLGDTYAELGDGERATDWYARALTLRQTTGELAAAARLHAHLGAVHRRAGSEAEALRQWRAAAAAYRRLGDAREHARALAEVARTQEDAGRARAALRAGREALVAARQADDTRLQAQLRARLADAYERAGEVRAARRHRTAVRQLRARAGEAGDDGVATDGGGDTTGGTACESAS